MPYHVAREFLVQRPLVIQEQFESYSKAEKLLSSFADSFRQAVPRHPWIPVDHIAQQIATLSAEMLERVETAQKAHKDLSLKDHILDRLLALFDRKCGDPPIDGTLQQWKTQIDARYNASIPPGFADSKKPGDRKYGDAIIWFQILEFAERSQRPIVLVTEDQKDDWWLRVGGKTIGPHPALIQEIHERSGVAFCMYGMTRFIEQAAAAPGGGGVKDLNQLIQESDQLNREKEESLRLLERQGTEILPASDERQGQLIEKTCGEAPGEARPFVKIRLTDGDRELLAKLLEEEFNLYKTGMIRPKISKEDAEKLQEELHDKLRRPRNPDDYV